MKKIFISLFVILLCLLIFWFMRNLEFTKASSVTLADTVIALNSGSTWEINAKGVYYTNSHEYRYIGRDVNNYVRFNNDMYRIIGVFDDNTHGVTGKRLVKLIRNRIFKGYAWGTYNTTNTSATYSGYKNDWSGTTTGVKANLNVLLNEFFYNKSATSTTYGSCSDWTYVSYYSSNYKGNSCNTLLGYGINNDYRSYIEFVTWYLNGYSSYNLTANNLYLCERGQYTGCSSGNGGAYSSTDQEYIGLMYGSDYMYASGNSSSNSTFVAGAIGNGVTNWMYSGNEWTFFIRNDTDNAIFYIGHTGTFLSSANLSYKTAGFRPVFYLKEDVYVTGGDGSFANPYTVACDNCS